MHWGALLPIVLPTQIAGIVGDARKELWNGIVPPPGAALSIVVTPLAGALSDRSRWPFGRRRPYMVVGTAVNAACLLALAGFGAGGSIALFLLVYLEVQLGNNGSGGPCAGLIPDVVSPAERGTASGWLALMTAVGFILGAVATGQLVRDGRYGAIYVAIAVVLVAMLALTLRGEREQSLEGAPPPLRAGASFRSFLLTDAEYRDFHRDQARRKGARGAMSMGSIRAAGGTTCPGFRPPSPGPRRGPRRRLAGRRPARPGHEPSSPAPL